MTSKPDHMKYKEGTKRSFRPNEWYVNKKAESEANRYFTGQKGGVPNNPQNFQSFMPVAAPVNPALSMQGDQVVRKNPYGDGEQVISNEAPIFTRPNQRGSSFDPPPVPVEKQGKIKREDSKDKRKGMSTSVGLMKAGPLRDISPM